MQWLLSYLTRHFSLVLKRPVRLFKKNGDKLSRQEIGQLGERMARSSLRARGWKILYKNYRGPRGGEVDIVARDSDTLSFVEVKTRTYGGYGRPLDAVDAEKRELIERGANSWLHLLGKRDFLWRFDVVEVILTDGEKPKVTVVEDAF